MSGAIKIYVDDENWNFDDEISIRLVKCGRERCLSDKKEENGNRIYCSLHYVLRGEGYLLVNKEKIELKKDMFFLFEPMRILSIILTETILGHSSGRILSVKIWTWSLQNAGLEKTSII